MKKKCKVIITEDDYDDADFLKDALRQNQFQGDIEHIENGEKLMRQLLALKQENLLPELIVLDLNMPFKSGYDVLVEMKSDPQLQNIPIAVVTASIRNEDKTYCDERGCSLFERKPISVHEYSDIAYRIVHLLKRQYSYC